MRAAARKAETAKPEETEGPDNALRKVSQQFGVTTYIVLNKEGWKPVAVAIVATSNELLFRYSHQDMGPGSSKGDAVCRSRFRARYSREQGPETCSEQQSSNIYARCEPLLP